MNVIQGCCFCSTCEIAADTFTRADNTDISANIVAPDTVSSWTESVGSWSITSNALTTSSGTAVVICNDTHPDADTTMVVESTIRHSNSGSWCDLLVALVSSTSYYYARYIFGTNSIQIRRNNAGVHTTLASVSATLAINTTYTASVCVDPEGRIRASLNGAGKVASLAEAVTGTQCGLGASASFGTATFDNFSFSKAYEAADAPACDACPNIPAGVCSNCGGSGTGASAYQVVITGVSDDTCTDCTNFNATFIVEEYADSPLCAGSTLTQHPCVRCWQLPVVSCTAEVMLLAFGAVNVTVAPFDIGFNSSVGFVFFAPQGGVLYTCNTSWNDAAFSNKTTANPKCNIASATCDVTAI